MKHITIAQQLNAVLFRHERERVNRVISCVEKEDDREMIRLGLLTFAKYRGLAKFTTEDPYLSILINGLRPYVELSLKKAEDPNYCLAFPEDAPDGNENENDNDNDN